MKLRDAMVAPIGQPSITIVSARPATTGDRPSTTCTYIGSALGATFFGAVFNFGLVRHNGGISVPEEQLRDLLQGTAVSDVGEAGLRLAVGSSLHLTFVVMLAMSGVILALALLLPRQGMSVRAIEAR